MLLVKMKINGDVFAEFKYTEEELKRMCLPELTTKFKKIAAEVIAEVVFKERNGVTSVSFVDTLNESPEGVWEIYRKEDK